MGDLGEAGAVRAPVVELWNGVDLGKEVDRVLLSRYSPAGVVVDEDLEVIEIRGQAAPYLKLPNGRMSFQLLTLIPETGFFLELEKLLQQVKEGGTPARREGLAYASGDAAGVINVEVVPLAGRQRRAYLILFESVAGGTGRSPEIPPNRPGNTSMDAKDAQIARLKQELANARERLLSVFEEHQTSQEESQSATEEALSSNEELQSLNEEMETAKEELQSTNEELITLNQEMHSKNQALARASHITTSIVETVREPFLVLDTDFRVTSANQAFYRAFRLTQAETEGQSLYSLGGGGWDVPSLRAVLDRVLPGDSAFQNFAVELDFAGLGPRALIMSGCRLDGLNLLLLAIDDVTERKKAEESLRKAEEHLRQAQKMEAIGRLAGGVAHDFNNLLTAILGYSDLLLLDSSVSGMAVEHVEEIKNAGERAASLTHQLLAFSRRQVLQPKVLDLNAVVADLDRILRRLIGERIELAFDVASDLWRVRADPGELGRVLMNLCLNARDAMPGGGTLTIRTANLSLDDDGARERDVKTGRYVLLAIADTGIGMEPDVITHIFEPFFTTKQVGKGTGLGLATVLGIVEQSGGTVRCDSSLGEGTTFSILLPAMAAEAERSRTRTQGPFSVAEGVL